MSPTLEGFDAAVGFTVQQHLFSLGITRAHLGALLGVPGQSVSSRLRGKVRWTAGDLAVVAEVLGVGIADLYPTRSGEGWVPAPYVPGASKAPVPGGAEAVAGTPCGARTHDLRIKSPQVGRCLVRARRGARQHWFAHCAIIASNSAIAGNSSKGTLR